MAYKRILTIQDISCVGQCSMTVALPILSVCGMETCILPSAVLSTHTGGFGDVTFRDLTEDMPAIRSQWERENITFDAIYTGYLGGVRQMEYVTQIFDTLLLPDGICVVDPAMADHGRLYAGFDEAYVDAMRVLCSRADILIPNLTEACMLTNSPYKDSFDRRDVCTVMEKLTQLGAKSILLTGTQLEKGKIGVALWQDGELWCYSHSKTDKSFHGTGDIFASAFVGAYMQGRTMRDAARIAADFTALCIRKTCEDPAHWYGVKFEAAIPELMRMLDL